MAPWWVPEFCPLILVLCPQTLALTLAFSTQYPPLCSVPLGPTWGVQCGGRVRDNSDNLSVGYTEDPSLSVYPCSPVPSDLHGGLDRSHSKWDSWIRSIRVTWELLVERGTKFSSTCLGSVPGGL